MKKYTFLKIFLIFALTIPVVSFSADSSAPSVVTPEYIKAKYNLVKLVPTSQKIRVLIVPGHDDDVHGTAFNDLEEVDFNRLLAEELYRDFLADPHFEPILTQTQAGYTETFKFYFENEDSEIDSFISKSRRAMDRLLRRGRIEPLDNSVEHNAASDLVVHRLYGINKWANENNIDLVIHIHFNDYGGRPWRQVGKYSGFTIYVPDEQLQNGATTQAIAPSLFRTLSKYIPISDLEGEEGGVTKDLELIAIGSNNSLIVPSMLIEYSYMYEPHLHDLKLREELLSDYARYTYEGVKNFFENREINPVGHGTEFLPHKWNVDLEKGMKDSAEVVAMQIALRNENLYPGEGKTLTDCPINGSFGPCTEAAVKAFQTKYGISSTGYVGPLTRGKLNALYSK